MAEVTKAFLRIISNCMEQEDVTIGFKLAIHEAVRETFIDLVQDMVGRMHMHEIDVLS